jgi:hypothetical protein
MNDFTESLKKSHEAEDNPIWSEIYNSAFPGFLSMVSHREDGWHQRAGIDRSIIMPNSKRILIDEKARYKNSITGKTYDDIALEYWSDRDRKAEGWVCKSLLCDYIAYAILPLGKCYLLPVIQLQNAWRKNKDEWIKKYKTIEAINSHWVTVSLVIEPRVLFQEIGNGLRINFTPEN